MSEAQRDPIECVVAYHERTKHRPGRYARALGYMDWANQPDPFRRFAGAPQLPLDDPPPAAAPNYDALFAPEGLAPEPLNRASVSRLFRNALALSAWKQVPGSEPWPLRVNPSSGNLHPTESYLLAGRIAGLSKEPSLYHYAPFTHALERRRALPPNDWEAMTQSLPADALLLALTSIPWRESWKYGERAFRYCHLDTGHAIAAIALSAAALGWETAPLETVADRDLAQLLGVHDRRGPEAEHPDCLLTIYPRAKNAEPLNVELSLPRTLLEKCQTAKPFGKPNLLSARHHSWPVIDEAAEASRFPGRETTTPDAADRGAEAGAAHLPDRGLPASAIINQRRSAQALDAQATLPRDAFQRMLSRLLPCAGAPPWPALSGPPRVTLILFVHAVEELAPGLYILARDARHLASLQAACRDDFAWEQPAGCPEEFPLFLLQEKECRDLARSISCQQDIASDGVFAAGMLAQFDAALETGAWMYPRLFWEAGAIGQILYLEAEAAGLRGTGIGCYFDDALHELLGIGDRSWQSMYHFTVGRPVDDPRLQTIPPYVHLAPRQNG